MPILIRLRWPQAALSPNDRSRTFHKGASAKRRYREECDGDARSQGLRKLTTARALLITFHNPTGRVARDRDNCIAAFKAGQDGIADVLGVDDGRLEVSHDIGPAVSDGLVVVEVR